MLPLFAVGGEDAMAQELANNLFPLGSQSPGLEVRRQHGFEVLWLDGRLRKVRNGKRRRIKREGKKKISFILGRGGGGKSCATRHTFTHTYIETSIKNNSQ